MATDLALDLQLLDQVLELSGEPTKKAVVTLALRRDGSTAEPEVRALARALAGADAMVTTGLVLQELLQGFNGSRAVAAIVERSQALPLIHPDRQRCRRGAQCCRPTG